MPILAATALAAASTIAGKLLGLAWMVWVFKPLTTLLIIAVAAARLRDGGAYARAVCAGLLLSLAGDVLLIPDGLFVAGLVAFLLAHVAYLVAFTRDCPPLARRGPFAAVAAVAAVLLTVLWPSLPAGLRVPVLAYVLMLGLMTGQALARARHLDDPHARRAGIGGVLFLCSDALLAFDRFHAPLPLAALWVLGTYYPAQMLIARSINMRAHARDTPTPPRRPD
ncbi:MAG TPA: lysoplasmalogenase [Quisquiliibacterium sp.]|nr:lysoplasmalogenase [Quisquiliibacterium sp.]